VLLHFGLFLVVRWSFVRWSFVRWSLSLSVQSIVRFRSTFPRRPLAFVVRRSPLFTVRRSSFAVRRSPFVVRRRCSLAVDVLDAVEALDSLQVY